MKSNYLFPIVFRKIGWCLFIPTLIAGICYMLNDGDVMNIGGSKVFALFDGLTDTKYLTFTQNDSWTDEVLVILLTVSMLFIGFSREKDEDECTAHIRMRSLTWAILMNSIMLVVGTLLIFGSPYLNFMVIYLFSILFLFIIKYTWSIHTFRKIK